MKFLLTAINAKFIHSNPAIYSLQAGVGEKLQPYVELAEFTINESLESILEGIWKRQPKVIGFSCYIWNWKLIREILTELPKILPDTEIWLGGPEVTYDGPGLLSEFPQVTGIMVGEGEVTFREVLEQYVREADRTGAVAGKSVAERFGQIPGLCLASGYTAPRELTDLTTLPFLYEDMEPFTNRIIYYETSRGCPYRCSYCLSSIDKKVRLRDIDVVKRELQFFLDHKVPQVKFVDRTFNCKHDHAMTIWQYIKDHDNGITNFHFEISADLLRENELELMSTMRPGLIQLEIGVQSTNPDTIRAIHRTMDFPKLAGIVNRIHSFKNIHQHLDLIAGLPYEDYDSFHRSFNDVYALRPQQLQLGFLKVLKGSHMKEMTEEYGIVHKELEPYEVLGTRWLPYEDILKLKMVESMVELYYNSGQFQNTIACVEPLFEDAFTLYEKLGQFYEKKGYSEISHSRMRRYEILLEFVKEELEEKSAGKSGNQDPEVENPAGKAAEDCRGMETATWEKVADSMIYDLYLRENLKSHPSFEYDQKPYEKAVWEYRRQEKVPKTAHIEVFRDGKILLFDYENRDPLLHNAAVKEIQI